ncbi:hypothetical protein MRB53_000319 [Persea americana]|uniref:Uncharacterized protein n=1 Tax=Persea americana TaxID=3435 RepID=A0ACC2MNQ5_PERAE|nr:hypothetical protein MRB53_000319 [Persea americana]
MWKPHSSLLSSAFFIFLLTFSPSAESSIHICDREPFKELGNSYLLSGGSEGIVAQSSIGASHRNVGSSVGDASSFIRFENVTFWRSKEAADKLSSAENSTGFIQAIIFEAADRDNIGGSAYGGQRSLCCTPDLAKIVGCKQGEVLRRPSSGDPNWPMIQNCITSVIVLGLFEMALWYIEYSNFNGSGMRPVGITTWVVTVGAVRKTLSRLLILCVSMGYGVVRPTLGGLTTKVLLLGVTYFLASELLDITENVGTISDISGKARLFLVLPDAFLDAFLILWIFTSLSKTLEKLQARRSYVKLDIYRKFTNALTMAVIASVAWIGYEIYYKATDPFNERWQSAWVITAFWDILAFGLLCVICYLWPPSQNSQRYAYSDELGEEVDEESVSLTMGTSEGDFSLVKQDKKEKSVGSAEVFSVEDGPEEDKRE